MAPPRTVDRDLIARLTHEGRSISEIATLAATTRGTVSQIKRELGLSKPPTPPADHDYIRQLLRQGVPNNTICVRVRVSHATVLKIKREIGLTKPTRPRLTPDELARARELLEDGASAHEAARTIGCNHGTILKHFPQYAWTRQQSAAFAAACRAATRKTSPTRKRRIIDKALIHKLVRDGLSTREVAAKVGCSKSLVALERQRLG